MRVVGGILLCLLAAAPPTGAVSAQPFARVAWAPMCAQEPGGGQDQPSQSDETPAKPGRDTAPADQAPERKGLVTNIFIETDLRQALNDIAVEAGEVIVPDSTVQGVVRAEFKDTPFAQALAVLLAVGNYEAKKMPEGYYLVGLAHPDNPNFPILSETVTYKPSFQQAPVIAAQLSQAFLEYVQVPKDADYMTITAGPRTLARILDDIKKIDQPAQRVVLEALVTEVSSEVLDEFNLSWTWRKFGITSSNDSMDLGYTSAAGKDVAVMKSLIADGKALVRANPRIMALEGEESSIDIGREAYYSIVTGPVNYPYTTLQKIVTGISLKMTPHVAADGQITVDLEPSVSDVVGTGTGGLPVNTVRKVKTSLRVGDGESIIIGGMTYESTSRRDTRVPIIGDIPVIGGLFRGHRTETKKTEVVVMITPHVVRDSQ